MTDPDIGEIASLAQNSLLQHIAALPADQRTKAQIDSLFNYYLADVDAPSRDLRRRSRSMRASRPRRSDNDGTPGPTAGPGFGDIR